jgi:hypothetical protein
MAHQIVQVVRVVQAGRACWVNQMVWMNRVNQASGPVVGHQEASPVCQAMMVTLNRVLNLLRVTCRIWTVCPA